MSQHQNGTANGPLGTDLGDGLSVVNGNSVYPAIVAQEVGRAIYHGRAKQIRIIGCAENLARITWILRMAPDLFDVLVDTKSLIITAHHNGITSCPETTAR
jgi:hypothetical protein